MTDDNVAMKVRVCVASCWFSFRVVLCCVLLDLGISLLCGVSVKSSFVSVLMFFLFCFLFSLLFVCICVLYAQNPQDALLDIGRRGVLLLYSRKKPLQAPGTCVCFIVCRPYDYLLVLPFYVYVYCGCMSVFVLFLCMYVHVR